MAMRKLFKLSDCATAAHALIEAQRLSAKGYEIISISHNSFRGNYQIWSYVLVAEGNAPTPQMPKGFQLDNEELPLDPLHVDDEPAEKSDHEELKKTLKKTPEQVTRENVADAFKIFKDLFMAVDKVMRNL